MKPYLAPVEPGGWLQYLNDEWAAGQQVAAEGPVHWPAHTPHDLASMAMDQHLQDITPVQAYQPLLVEHHCQQHGGQGT